MTPFDLLLRLAGLSLDEAARFLDVRPDTVASWRQGRRNPREAVLDELRRLISRQEQEASNALAIARDLRCPADDTEAQSLGWPCVGAWRAMAGRVIAASHSVALVPRR